MTLTFNFNPATYSNLLAEIAPKAIAMESSGIRQSDLVGKLGSSGVVSEIVNGKRSISKAQAKVLSDMFKVSPSLFI